MRLRAASAHGHTLLPCFLLHAYLHSHRIREFLVTPCKSVQPSAAWLAHCDRVDVHTSAGCAVQGVASAEDIDLAMKKGTHQHMGPLHLADYIGLDTCLNIMRVLHSGLGEDKYRPCPMLVQLVDAGAPSPLCHRLAARGQLQRRRWHVSLTAMQTHACTCAVRKRHSGFTQPYPDLTDD